MCKNITDERLHLAVRSSVSHFLQMMLTHSTGQLSSSGQVTFPQDCDESRNYPSAKEVLKANNKSELITFMDKYWLSNKNDNEGLWEHEWNKHGTCMSTLEPGCLPPSSKKGADAALYFQRAVDLFKASDTYSFLAEAGIRPDSRKQFSLEEITQAIKAKHGATPALDCRNGRLSQIYYYFHLQGSAIDGTFLPVEPLKPGSCPKTNISYPPKNGAVTPTSTVTSARPSQTTPTSDVSRATIAVRTSDGTTTGCLLSTGRWSTQTCAKMNIITVDNGFTLTSSRGDCAIVSGEFTCGNSANPPSVFTATALNGENLLAFDGSTAFTANSIPRGSTQVTLSTGSDGVNDLTLVINGV
ncbi:ribonuclease T2-like [Tulasnella sp. 419]|nr:ribonuclease T2-like [Tulasnella sp. 419]